MPGFSFQGKALDQNRAIRKSPSAIRCVLDLFVTRYSQPSLLEGTVRPQFDVDGIRDDRWQQSVFRDRCEQTGVTQLARKRSRFYRGIQFDPIESAGVVDHEKLARVVHRKASDLKRRISQLTMKCDLSSIVANAPNLAGRIVSVDEASIQLRQLVTSIDNPTGQAP